jgi:hypothetical protein
VNLCRQDDQIHLLQHISCARYETNTRAGTQILAFVFQPSPEWRVGLLWFALARNPRQRLADGWASYVRPLKRCVPLVFGAGGRLAGRHGLGWWWSDPTGSSPAAPRCDGACGDGSGPGGVRNRSPDPRRSPPVRASPVSSGSHARLPPLARHAPALWAWDTCARITQHQRWTGMTAGFALHR